MVTLASLWLPILLSAVIVFVASSIVHMALKYHNTDYQPLPQEGAVMQALRPFNLPPGDFIAPHASSNAERQSPEFKEKVRQGPVMMLTVYPAAAFENMGARLVQWFFFSVLVSLFAAYIGSRALPAGTLYLDVMQITGTVAFTGYALAHLPASIWYDRKWSTTAKNVFDGLVYGLLTGGTFGWLWP